MSKSGWHTLLLPEMSVTGFLIFSYFLIWIEKIRFIASWTRESTRRSAWWTSVSGCCLGQQTINSTDRIQHRGHARLYRPWARLRGIFNSFVPTDMYKNTRLIIWLIAHRFITIDDATESNDCLCRTVSAENFNLLRNPSKRPSRNIALKYISCFSFFLDILTDKILEIVWKIYILFMTSFIQFR